MPVIEWSVGLINCKSGKYLTGEKFGFKVVANGASLKANQIWTLHVDGTSVFIQSPHKRYLSTTEKGVVSAEVESAGASEKFELVSVEGAAFAFKSAHGYFFGGVDDQISCFEKKTSAEYSWKLHLAMHPHVCLRNEQRKTYARLGGNELRLKAEVPFGPESAVLLEFDKETGKYSLQASNAKYLSTDGSLVDSRTPASEFTVEFHGEAVAFRDAEGKYLAGVGPDATMKGRRTKVDKDERFYLEDSKPQVSIIACSNNKRVSCSVRGLEMSASVMLDDDLGADQIFQYEINPETNRVALRTSRKTYASSASATLLANADSADDNCFYEVDWHDGYVTLKTANGRLVTTKPNGTLAANADSDASSDTTHYIITLVNRPVIVFRGCFGFVSKKGAASNVLECNRSTYDVFTLEAAKGTYHLIGANGKPWSMDDAKSTFSVTGSTKDPFKIELPRPSRLLLRAKNGKFLRGESNGMFSATGDSMDKNTLWEY